jgi:hypothetical protein
MTKPTCLFFNDNEIAALLGMSASWVRGERFKRKNGKKHTLSIDPVYIGKMPKYHRSDIEDLIEDLSSLPAFE